VHVVSKDNKNMFDFATSEPRGHSLSAQGLRIFKLGFVFTALLPYLESPVCLHGRPSIRSLQFEAWLRQSIPPAIDSELPDGDTHSVYSAPVLLSLRRSCFLEVVRGHRQTDAIQSVHWSGENRLAAGAYRQKCSPKPAD